MTVTWERFSGSTDTFAIRLAFMPDPDNGAGVDPDESRSWGALQIWANGQNLCSHTDQGEVLQSAHWYLLPFLEWVASGWNPILHEERLPSRNAGDTAAASLNLTRRPPSLATDAEAQAWEEEWYEWRERHAIRSARSGGLLPNVLIRRLRDSIEVSWDDDPLAGTDASFRFNATNGSALLPADLVANCLFDIVSQAADHLLNSRPESSRLQKLHSVISAIPDSSQIEERMGWMAGLRISWQSWQQSDLSGLAKQTWQKVRQGLEHINAAGARAALATDGSSPIVVSGSCQAALLFGSVDPSISEADVLTLSRILIRQYDETGSDHMRLFEFSEDAPLLGYSPAWLQGYDLAETLHDENDLGDEFVDIDDFIQRLGVEVTEARLEDVNIRACSLVSPQHKPTIALNSSYYSGDGEGVKRFTLAHELCHLLYDRSRGQRLAIASGRWAPVTLEKRANAFAAMLLMPPHLLRTAMADSPCLITEREGIKFLCERLKVSFTAIVEHLYNQTFMTEEARDRLLRLPRS